MKLRPRTRARLLLARLRLRWMLLSHDEYRCWEQNCWECEDLMEQRYEIHCLEEELHAERGDR